MLLIRAHLALALQLAEIVHDVAADVSHRHPPLLGDPVHDLHQLLAALLGELGIDSRITWPSFDGVSPTSDSRIAFSIALIEFLS